MAASFAAHGIITCCLAVVGAIEGTGTTNGILPSDHCSLLQHNADVHVGSRISKRSQAAVVQGAISHRKDVHSTLPPISASTKDPSGIVQRLFRKIAQHGFRGDKCQINAATFFEADAVIDARGPTDIDYFKMYPSGLSGVCEYFNKSSDYELYDMHASMYTKGNRIVHVMSYVPGFSNNNARASQRLTQYNVYRLNGDMSKLAGFDVFFDNPAIYDQLSDYTAVLLPTASRQMGIIEKLFSAWGKGKFSGSACELNAGSFFSSDAVIDLEGPEKDRHVFKQYSPGLGGVCEFLNQTSYTFNDLKSSMYPRGDEIVQFLDYIPGLGGSSNKTASGRVQQYHVWWFHPETFKILGVDSFCDRPTRFDEIFMLQQAEAKAEIELKAAKKALAEKQDLIRKVSMNSWQEKQVKRQAAKSFNEKVATMLDITHAFAEGKLKGDQCLRNVGKLFTENAVIDYRMPSGSAFFKRYDKGRLGICEYYDGLYSYDFHGLTSSMYAKGDSIVKVLSYTPADTKADKQVPVLRSQCNVFKFQDSDIASAEKKQVVEIEAFFHNPVLFDELQVANHNATEAMPSHMHLVDDVLNGISQGLFFDDDCQETAQLLFAPDVVVDFAGPQKDADVFKQYNASLDGLCEFLNKVPLAYETKDLKSSRYPRGDEMVQVLNYVPGLPGPSGRNASGRVLQYVVWKFTKDKEKISRIDSFWDKPFLFDEIYALGMLLPSTLSLMDKALDEKKVVIEKMAAVQVSNTLTGAQTHSEHNVKGSVLPGEHGDWKCKEGNEVLAFQKYTDCSNFTEEELDMPLVKWPHLQRWCKLAKRHRDIMVDQCAAQHCIAEESPTDAAEVWWQTKIRDSPSWRAVQLPYCMTAGYCMNHPLGEKSKMVHMEAYCDQRHAATWRTITPRIALRWLDNWRYDYTFPFGADDSTELAKSTDHFQLLGCAMGIAHCEATRCQRYFCGNNRSPMLPSDDPVWGWITRAQNSPSAFVA